MKPLGWYNEKRGFCCDDFEALGYGAEASDWVPLYALPPGWAIVPTRPTEKMVDAAYDAKAAFDAAEPGVWCGLSSAYQAMIAAAPAPPGSR